MTVKHKGKTQKNKGFGDAYINPRQLNINTIIKKHISNNIKNNSIILNSDITVINNILNNNTSQKPNTDIPINNTNNYNIIKYLGEGIQGSLYLANDTNKQRYICKKINIDTNNSNQLKQIEFELNILKYLSTNKVTREHINPCVEHKIIDNNIFTIFPVFDGYSLNHLLKYLKELDNNSYYKIVFHLIKTILHGLAKIHQFKIAHQNINNNSILVSTYTNPKEINVKFTDFGLGCGNNMDMDMDMDIDIDNSNMVNIDKYEKYEKDEKDEKYNFNSNIKFNSCKVNNFTPVTITDDIMSNLVDSDYLAISQKYDLLCLGFIFIKLLLFFDNLDIDVKKGYDKVLMQHILQLLNDKYLSNFNTNVNTDSKLNYKTILPFINVSNSVKRDILEYLKIFKEYVLCKTSHRQTCQYVLDKLIIYEKYKDEVF